jgi:hypothetical protein
MQVAVLRPAPADEFDAELEAGLRLADEIVLVDAERAVEQADLRNRGLADADDADFVGLDQADRDALAEYLGQCGGRHPTRGAAADDDDFAYPLMRHVLPRSAWNHRTQYSFRNL